MSQKIAHNQAVVVSVSASGDLDQLEPGAPFDVTWSFRNRGTTTWDAQYQLAYTDETQPDASDYPHSNLASNTAFSLADLGGSARVEPGDAVYLTLNLTAPLSPGTYLTAWQLQTPGAERFGPVRELRVVVGELLEKGLGDLAYEMVGFENSIKNYNNMSAGQPFTGTWTLKNAGFQAWNGDFRVAYHDLATGNTVDALGDRMGTEPSYTLRDVTGRDSVDPEENVIIRLNFTAPQQPGIYAYHWQLVSDGGVPFGGVRWMRIVVAKADGTSPPEPSDGLPFTHTGPKVTFFTGIHGPADDFVWGQQRFQDMINRLGMPVFFMSHGSNPDFSALGDPQRNVVRLYWNPRPVTADEAYEEVRDDQLRRWWDRGYRRFVFFNEPQLDGRITRSEEGFGIAWNTKEEFARFLKTCLARALQEFPGIQLYTTPMTSNEAFDPWGWRHTMWAHVKGHVHGWCMHAYTGDNSDANAAAQDIANQVVEVQRRLQLQIPVIVSEASVNRGDNAAQKAEVARLLPAKLAHVGGVEGVFWYASDWNPDFDTHHEGWFRSGIADAYLQQAA
jgi:hypothetical protein